MTGEDRELARLLEMPEPLPGCPSDWMLQRLVAEDLKSEERDTVAAHSVSCAHCRARVAELDVEREGFLRAHPFDEVEAEIAERALFVPDDPEIEVAEPLWTRWRTPLSALSAGAVAALVVAGMWLPGRDVDPLPYTGHKGTTALAAALLRDGVVADVDGETTVRTGDELQFAVDTGSYDHVVLVGIDGTDAVTVYLPADGGRSQPVEPGAGRVLDGAFRLDEAPGPEVFVAFFTDEPIDAREAAAHVRRWAAEGGAAAVVDGAPDAALGGAVEVLLLDKESATP